MTSDEPPAQRGWRPQDEAAAPSVLDQCFDASSLSALRASTQTCAAQAGMPAERATDVVIALHELAANAVRHGAGHGRLRLWQDGDTLHCQVTDDGPAAAGPASPRDHTSPGTNGSLWDSGHGHGLWLVRQVADHTDGHAGPDGTTVNIRFKLGTADTS